ncbi:hypothetical protein C8J57DRAFT_1246313 [Mycena rebaudengoi]|nr:hypothetical protein C8J57DRAFT_1246313 [Mycena rebaudengoi]
MFFVYLSVHAHQIPFLYTILTNQGEDTTGYKIVMNMISQLSAIYPVIIALLVSLDRTNLESTVIGISTNTDSDSIHFVGNTTGYLSCEERANYFTKSEEERRATILCINIHTYLVVLHAAPPGPHRRDTPSSVHLIRRVHKELLPYFSPLPLIGRTLRHNLRSQPLAQHVWCEKMLPLVSPTLSFIQAHPPASMLLCLIRSSLLLLAYDTRPGGDTTALRCSSQKAWTAPGGELRGYSFAGDLARGSTLETHPRLEARRNSTHRIADTAAFAGGCRALFAVRSGGRLSDSFSRSRSGIRSLSFRLETAGGGWAGLVNREW